MINYKIFTVGIEEEYMVIDPNTKELAVMNKRLFLRDKKSSVKRLKQKCTRLLLK
jgi:gamma-glutamyl:cysteine ligase YbdK (ATP-grasp superfamily)